MPSTQRPSGAPTRIKLFRRSSGETSCVACGQQIASAEETVAVQGLPFHVACALYSRRSS